MDLIVDEAFEDKVLACMLRSRDFCTVAAMHLKPTHFDSPVKHNLAKMARDFFSKYSVCLTAAAFGDLLTDLVKKAKVSKEDVPVYGSMFKRMYGIDISDSAYTLEKLVDFIKLKEYQSAFEQAIKNDLPKSDFNAVAKRMAEIGNINTRGDVEAYDIWNDKNIDERTERRAEEAARPTMGISTGIKKLDDALPKCGWYPKELAVVMAPPKSGKTMSLLFFANMAAWQGFNVAYFTCEVSKEVCSERVDAMNTGTELKALSVPAYIKDVAAKMKSKKPSGKLFVLEYPTKMLSPNEAERQLKKLELMNERIDIAFFDYGDIMKPNQHNDDELRAQASVFEDLRGIAGKFVIPVVTATQVNRVGSDKEIITGKDVSGTWEKIMVADAIMSLCGSQADRKDGKLLIHLAEMRNAESKTFKITTKYGMGKFYDQFISEVR